MFFGSERKSTLRLFCVFLHCGRLDKGAAFRQRPGGSFQEQLPVRHTVGVADERARGHLRHSARRFELQAQGASPLGAKSR